jgi:hypothetical protein
LNGAGGSHEVLRVTIGFTDSPDVGEVGAMLQLIAEAYSESLASGGVEHVRLGVENLQIGSLIAYLTEIIQAPEALLPADGGLRLRAFVSEMAATINILRDASNLHIPIPPNVAPAMGRLLGTFSLAIAAGRAVMMRTEVPGFNGAVAELDQTSSGQIMPALMRINQEMLGTGTGKPDADSSDWRSPKRRIVSPRKLERLIRYRAKNLAVRAGEPSDTGVFAIRIVGDPTPDGVHWRAVGERGHLNRFVREAVQEYLQTHDVAAED